MSFLPKPKTTYAADHAPTGETWRIVGIDTEDGKVFVGGFRDPAPRTGDEEDYMYRYWTGFDQLEGESLDLVQGFHAILGTKTWRKGSYLRFNYV